MTMADEILKDEILSDEQLDNVNGGSWLEFTADMLDAKKRGIAGSTPTATLSR